MNGSQNIPWKRISIEAVAIVASILLAFAIDAWWDDRTEQKEFVAQLRVFENELTHNTESINRSAQVTSQRVESINRVLSALASEEPVPDSIYADIGDALWYYPFPVSTSALTEILNSGTLQRIQNSRLAVAIGEYSKSVESLRGISSESIATYRESTAPALASRMAISDLGWEEYDYYDHFEGRVDVTTPKASFSRDPEDLKTPAIWNALYGWKVAQIDTLRFMHTVRQSVLNLRALLEEEIERSGH